MNECHMVPSPHIKTALGARYLKVQGKSFFYHLVGEEKMNDRVTTKILQRKPWSEEQVTQASKKEQANR